MKGCVNKLDTIVLLTISILLFGVNVYVSIDLMRKCNREGEENENERDEM